MRIRFLLLGLTVAVSFVLVAIIMLMVLPEPRRPIDFLIAGGVGTMVAMLVLFFGLTSTTMKSDELFFKRRR